jgi:hypothetical protein
MAATFGAAERGLCWKRERGRWEEEGEVRNLKKWDEYRK